MRSLAAALFLGALLAGVSPARAQAAGVREIKPPFGLSWNETAERLQRLLQGAKATVVQRRTLSGDREAWDVEGLLQTGLKRTIFYLRRGELIGVELQYQREDWDEAKYNDYMTLVRRRIDQQYGVGRQIVRKTEPEGAVTQTVVGYQWNLNNTAIELFFYTAQDEANMFRTLSVHYKEL